MSAEVAPPPSWWSLFVTWNTSTRFTKRGASISSRPHCLDFSRGQTASDNRHGHRDALMILLTFRHGLRAAEACELGAGGLQNLEPARSPRKERHAQHLPIDWTRIEGAAIGPEQWN